MKTKLLFPFLLCLVLASCKSGYYSMNDQETSKNKMLTTSSRSDAPVQSRKMIYSGNVRLTVTQPDSASRSIARIAEAFGGYPNQISTERVVIRVKAADLDAVIAAIARLGKVQSREITGLDVTEEYADYDIRLTNALRARDRYLELLAASENVATTLQVEKELERLNETIELLKGKMQRLDHLEAYSTLTIDLIEKKKPGIVGYIGLGLYYSVKWLFVR